MEFTPSHIRNIAILGHQGVGKTTLTESLYAIVNRTPKGSIEKKNTISDYLKEEKSRLSSVSTSLIPLYYEGHKLNLLDIPGNDDFVWEVLSVTHSVKGAILIIDASNKVQVGTVRHFQLLRKQNIPTIIYVNKMDKGTPDFEDILGDITAKLGKMCVPFTMPLGHDDRFDGFVNVVDLKARRFNGTECVDDIIYDDKKLKVFELHNTICEAVALTDEALLEKFFAGEPLSNEEIHAGLRKGVLNGELVPILFGSAEKNIGLHTLLSMLIDYLPHPADLKPYSGTDDSGREVLRYTREDEPFSAYILKTTVDPYLGTVHMLKIDSGILKLGDEVLCPQTHQRMKITSLFSLCGKQQTALSEAVAGDIVAISKCDGLETSFTLCDPAASITYKQVKFPTAVCFKAISVSTKKDEEKLNPALAKLKKEDPTLEIRRNAETKQLLIGGVSDTHLQFTIEKLRSAYGISLSVEEMKICYRETITRPCKATGRYIKQTGGSGFYGVVDMKFDPVEEDSSFEEEIFGGSVPKNYIPAVEKGFFEALNQGQLAGFPVIRIKGTLLDGKYHSVDSNELSFRMAAILSFREAYTSGNPTILEPILSIRIHADKKYMGDILSDLNSRRGKIENILDKEDDIMEIVSTIPESETLDYSTKLRSLTQGSGFFNRTFSHYEEVPEALKERVIKENSLLEK